MPAYYVTAGTQNMMNSACKCCLVMPMQWYQNVASHYIRKGTISESSIFIYLATFFVNCHIFMYHHYFVYKRTKVA
jgi:hypothetical protein